MASETMRCRKCGAVLTDGRPILRGEDWAQCGSVRDCYARKSTDDIADWLERESKRLLTLDSGSREGINMRDAALRIRALEDLHEQRRDDLIKLTGNYNRALRELRDLVDQQSNDEGLWFYARTAPEAYLQQELRRLHELIETVSS